MSPEEIMRSVMASSDDKDGIRDRFGDNTKLFAICITEFLKEPNFEMLERSLAAKDYKNAFAAAHAIKGVAGNLGLTGIYKSVCALVESLRANNITLVSSEYAEVLNQFRILRETLS